MKTALSRGLSIALTAAACSANSGSAAPDTRGTGTLVQSWTIDGSSDPSVCATYGAAQMRLILYYPDGTLSATALESCEAFVARRIVVAESYTGIVTFLDASGAAVSETFGIAQFAVPQGVETQIRTNFPASAMHPPEQ